MHLKSWERACSLPRVVADVPVGDSVGEGTDAHQLHEPDGARGRAGFSLRFGVEGGLKRHPSTMQLAASRMHTVLQTLVRGFQDTVFPPVCVHCRGLVEVALENVGGFRQLCKRCVAQLSLVHAPHCTTCGHPFYGEMEGGRRCPRCEGLDPAFREGRTAVLFKGPARALVIELKYHHGWHVLGDMTEILRRAPHVLELARDAWLIPVPLHPRKERERGYNQAALLAAAVARVAGGTTRVVPWLKRTADTATQTALDRRSRMANLKNAFALARGAALNPAHHYILVDDVFTTGSTLNGCARTLRRAGALNVDVITFGHG